MAYISNVYVAIMLQLVPWCMWASGNRSNFHVSLILQQRQEEVAQRGSICSVPGNIQLAPVKDGGLD